jgi:hypothetical protein
MWPHLPGCYTIAKAGYFIDGNGYVDGVEYAVSDSKAFTSC